jgi:phage terminase small subunit
MPGVKGRSGGHNAKTAKAHKLAGTFQKVRHAGIRNPDPPPGLPVPPKLLTGDAAGEWERMLVRLATSKTLSGVDAGAMYQCCCMFAETEVLAVKQMEVADAILVLKDSLADFKGPELIAAFQELTKMLRLESQYTTQIRQGRMGLRVYYTEFGLTPASRGRVKLPDAKPDADEFDEFDGTVN